MQQHNSFLKVMNSHAPSINIQGGQSVVVVGHHRGFSQPSSNSSADPWFLQTTSSSTNNAAAAASSHQMAPTAPARQHKRPAPQPGLMAQNSQLQQQQQQQSQSNLHDPSSVAAPHHPVNIVRSRRNLIFWITLNVFFIFLSRIECQSTAFIGHSIAHTQSNVIACDQHIDSANKITG